MTIRYGLKDKVVLITGGSRGIGFEIAKWLINEEQAKVAICGRKIESLDAASQALGAPENLLTVQAHIAKESDVEQLFSSVIAKFGRLDVLINNVGMNLITGAIADLDPQLWQKIIENNLTGTFLCSRKAAGILREQKSGKIVNISSIAARKASPAMGIYGIAKAGIEMMTKVLAAEMAPFGVQVNAVAPSMVRTGFSKPFWSNADIYKHIQQGIPMGRIAEMIEVVHPVLFLASEGAGFITGQTILVDGGTTAV